MKWPSQRWRIAVNLAAGQGLALTLIVIGLSGRHGVK